MLGDNKGIPFTPDELQNALNKLRIKFAAVITPCGSRVTCNPPPTDTDEDYLVLVPRDERTAAAIVSHLCNEGWDWDGSEHYQSAIDGFMSWKRGAVNLIITSNQHFWERHGLATAVCAKLNLMNKRDRITLFQAILYDKVGDAIARPPENLPGSLMK